MRKVLVVGIAVAMVMGLAGMSSAYLIKGSAKDSRGGNYMTSLQIGDPYNATAEQPLAVHGTVEMGLPTDQSWRPTLGPVAAQTWNYRLLSTPAPDAWVFALWGNAYAQPTANVKFWIQSLGDNGDFGTIVTGQTWELKDLTTNEVLWTGSASATGNEVDPWCNLVLPVINTVTPQHNAAVYSLAPVPEPGSLLALGSGLVGLVGFALRRRR